MAFHLLALPHEVIHFILTLVDPQDVAALSCCRSLHRFIQSDRLLCKELYLKNYDDPRKRPGAKELDWDAELRQLVKTEKILSSEDGDLKKQHLENIVQSVDYLLTTCTTGQNDAETSRNMSLLLHLLGTDQVHRNELQTASSLYNWAHLNAWRARPSCLHFRRATAAMRDPEDSDDSAGEGDDEEEDDEDEVVEQPDQEPLQEDIDAEADDEDDEPDADQSSSNLSHVFVSGIGRPSEGTRSGRQRRRLTPRPPPIPQVDQKESIRRQMSAKLHCLSGVPVQQIHRNPPLAISPHNLRRERDKALIHPYARSRVYDLRQHTETSLWGPFFPDGTQKVDWEKIEAIMLILDHNMKLYCCTHERPDPVVVPRWDKPFEGAAPYSYVSRKTELPMEPSLPLEAQDPYNITGTWYRVVCFLDYTELFEFNFQGHYPPGNQPRPALDTEEAIRLITMKLVVSKIEPPGEEDGQDLPVVHFKGTSSSVRPSWDPNANSKIRGVYHAAALPRYSWLKHLIESPKANISPFARGTVKLTPEGEVRWTTWSIFHGEERWRSEGIQVGGVQSARGVLGYWFDKDFDEHGPAGPTAFWKSHDGIEAPQKRNERSHELHALHMPMY